MNATLRTRSAPAILAVVALVLSACGGVATLNERDAADCGSPIKIGAPHPLSGPFAEFGSNSVQGAQLAVEQINAAGGITALGGAHLEIVPGDTAMDPNQAASLTTRMVETDGVVALVGSYASNLTLTASTSAEKARVPMVSQSWVDELASRGYEYYFQPPPQSSEFGTIAAEGVISAAQANGTPFTRAAVAGSSDSATTAQMTNAAKSARAAGLEVADPTLFPVGITDATPIASGLAAQDPDLIFLGGGVGDISLIIKALRARGVDVPIVGTGGAYVTAGIVDALDGDVEGLLSASAWSDDLDLPGVAEAAAAYEARFGTDVMPMEAGESWVDVHLIATAMEVAKSCAPQDIRDVLATHEFTDGPAAAMPGGTIKFNEAGLNEHSQPIIVQWQSGRLVTVWPERYATSAITLDSLA